MEGMFRCFCGCGRMIGTPTREQFTQQLSREEAITLYLNGSHNLDGSFCDLKEHEAYTKDGKAYHTGKGRRERNTSWM